MLLIRKCPLQVELSLWDTAGQERFHSLGPIYYRDAAAALIVFDITDIDSFERAKAWVKELKQMVRRTLMIETGSFLATCAQDLSCHSSSSFTSSFTRPYCIERERQMDIKIKTQRPCIRLAKVS